jgi:signal transduction histidine kinase/DNA-binding response OmpR family regulator
MRISTAISVLVVDDEVGVTSLCARVLERAGYQAQTVNQPHQAIEILQSEKVDLLLADIRMPEMDGFDLMTYARKHQPDLAVVIMTGYGTVETAVESLRQGADGMVLKPFSGAELVQSVQRAFRDRQRERDMLRLQALQPLFTITESLFSEKDPLVLHELLVEFTRQHLACEHVALYQRQGEGVFLEKVAGCGMELPGDDILISKVDTTDKAILIQGEGPGDPDLQRILIEKGFASVMCVPTFRGDRRSVFFVARTAGESPFGNADLEMLGILANQAAVALENARLYEELRQHIQQVEQSQHALLQAEKMAAVGRLTASIAHEINNPLQSMQNCLHLAGHHDLSPDQRQNYLDLAVEQLERLMLSVRRMLDFYRPSAVARKLTDLNQVTERVLTLLAAQLKSQNIKVNTRFARKLPLVRAVANQIEQVLFNLILNAMEAMPDGGELFLESQAKDGEVRIFIEDTGPGIPKAEAEQIFEPFVSTKEKGLGLGLTVSYGIVTAHGGHLDLLPPEKRGARFCLSLPL